MANAKAEIMREASFWSYPRSDVKNVTVQLQTENSVPTYRKTRNINNSRRGCRTRAPARARGNASADDGCGNERARCNARIATVSRLEAFSTPEKPLRFRTGMTMKGATKAPTPKKRLSRLAATSRWLELTIDIAVFSPATTIEPPRPRTNAKGYSSFEDSMLPSPQNAAATRSKPRQTINFVP